MGRKPKAEKLTEKAPMAESLSSSLVVEEENVNPELPNHPEAVRPVQSKAREIVKPTKSKSMIVRRSGRIQNVVRPVQNREIEPVIEEINLIESEREEEPYVEVPTHEPIPDELSLEQKVDCILLIVEGLRSKGFNSQKESTSSDYNYKELYFDSQKKIEALNGELSQLNKKLEFALGRLEAYESVKDIMDKLKEVMLISNLSKASEMVINLSSQLAQGQFSCPQAEALQDTADVLHTSPMKKLPNTFPTKKSPDTSPTKKPLNTSPMKKKKRLTRNS